MTLFDAIDLAGTFGNFTNVGAHTDSAGVAFVQESTGTDPQMKFFSTPNGSPAVHLGQTGSGGTKAWKSSSNLTLGRWAMFALWKRTSATGGTLSSYLSQHGASPYSSGGGYIWAGGNAFILNRRGTTRGYKILTSTPGDPLNDWCILSCGCEPGTGPWAKINGVSITATNATDTGGGTTSVVGDFAAYDSTFAGPLYRGGQAANGIDARGFLAFEMWLGYSPDATEQTDIADYITRRFINLPYTAPAWRTGAAALFTPNDQTQVLTPAGTLPDYMGEIGWLGDVSGKANHATATTGNAPFYLRHDGRNYLAAHNETAAPSELTAVAYHSSHNIADELTIDLEIALEDWTPAVAGLLAARAQSSSFVWGLYIGTDGKITFQWFPSGGSAATTVATGFANNQRSWIRVHWIRDTGAGQYSLQVYTSPDDVTYTQLGTTVTGTSPVALPSASVPFLFGSRVTSLAYGPDGRFYTCRLYNGNSAGTLVMEWSADDSTHLANTGLDRVNSSVVTYCGAAPAANQMRALIAEGAIWTKGKRMTLTNTIPLGNFRSAFTVTNVAPSLLLVLFGGATNGATPFCPYISGNAINYANSSGYIIATGTAGQGRREVIGGITGTTGFVQENGSTLTPTSYVASAGPAVSYLFSRGADYSHAVVGRFGLWAGATLPATADMQSFLNT